MAISKEAEKARLELKKRFSKTYGEGTLKTAELPNYVAISTGSLKLDKAMGAGGFIRGRIAELWGIPSGGKSAIALCAIASAQKQFPNELAAYIDIERTFDGTWAETLGVDREMLDIIEPENAEQVADQMKELIRSGLYSIIVLDSIGAMLPQEEFDKDAEQVTVGTIAKIITRMVKIAAVEAKTHNVAIVVINQVRAAIGAYGKTMDTGGGWGLKHVTSHKLAVKRASVPYTIGNGETQVNVGYEMSVKVEKCKVAPEGRTAKFGFFTMETDKYGPAGIDKAQEALTLGVDNGVITKAGAWHTFPDGEKAGSKELAVTYLRKHPDVIQSIRLIALSTVAHELVDDGPIGDKIKLIEEEEQE